MECAAYINPGPDLSIRGFDVAPIVRAGRAEVGLGLVGRF